ncbi:MAG: sporulation transcription factor Spo0A, partial [Eubacteriales bacterium]|nr:sporulation transcription factor Spo0A [Eubacteriales bacterium]
MEDIRLLVVDDHRDVRALIKEFMQKQEGIGAVLEAENGAAALEIVTREPIDVMITDIVMPQMDGFALLDALRKLEIPQIPKAIVVTALARDDFVMRAIELGIAYYMVKPVDLRQLYGRILEAAGLNGRDLERSAPPIPNFSRIPTVDERLGGLFLTLGIPAHIKGYSFLREAVKAVMEHPGFINNITKELYPFIGKRYSTSSSKVERAIRHAIEVAWNRGRIETLNRAFGCKVCNKDEKPTNGEFIAM